MRGFIGGPTARLILGSLLLAGTLLTQQSHGASAQQRAQRFAPISQAIPSALAADHKGNAWIGFQRLSQMIRVSDSGHVSSFPLPSGLSVAAMAIGPDNSVWFVDGINPRIWHLDAHGVVKETALPAHFRPGSLAVSSDGAVWCVDTNAGLLVRITPSGGITGVKFPDYAGAFRVAAGSGGTVWIIEQVDDQAAISQVSARGTITTHVLPAGLTPNVLTQLTDGSVLFVSVNEKGHATLERLNTKGKVSAPRVVLHRPTNIQQFLGAPEISGLAAGPDGSFWYSEPGASYVDQVTARGITRAFSMSGHGPLLLAVSGLGVAWASDAVGPLLLRQAPGATFRPISLAKSPTSSATDPRGNVWFTEYDGNAIGRLTPTGQLHEYPVPTAASGPSNLIQGPNGTLLFTESGTCKIGVVAMTGTITERQVDDPSCGLSGIAAGPDGTIWVSESEPGAIVALLPSGQRVHTYITLGTGVAGLVRGDDGTLWFTVNGEASDLLCAMAPSGDVSSVKLDGSFNGDPAVGANGTAWFGGAGTIDVLSGTDRHSIPLPDDASQSTSGGQAVVTALLPTGDGGVWFSESSGVLGRVNGDGAVETFKLPAKYDVHASGLSLGADGTLWFVDTQGNLIGRRDATGAIRIFALEQ